MARSLELDGAGVQVLSGGASSALSGLTANYGTLVFRGEIDFGAGGATVTTRRRRSPTMTSPTWTATPSATAAAAVTFGGTLTNDGTLDIGNASLSASTTVRATTLANNGTLSLQGNAASGTTNKASLILSGKAAATSAGAVRVRGDATLQVRQRRDHDDRREGLARAGRRRRREVLIERRGEFGAVGPDRQLRDADHSRRRQLRRWRRGGDDGDVVHQL